MNKNLAVAIAMIATGTVVTACGPAHKHATVTPAPSMAARHDAVLAEQAAGVPSTTAGQVAFARGLLTCSGRVQLAQRLRIPPARRSAFESAVLSAAEHGHLGTNSGRTTFFEVTLPQLTVRYEKL